jgi:hypothetical protein
MLWICKQCTCAYSVGAWSCPECGADDHIDEGTVILDMEEAADVVGPVPVDSEGSGADPDGGAEPASDGMPE